MKSTKIGEKWGYLTITGTTRRDRTYHVVRCDCGNIKEVLYQHLKKGKTKSCGCKSNEMKVNIKHGGWKTRIYQTHSDMKQRCLNPNNPRYHRYGGRGIVICEEWMSFESFRDWAYSNGYSDDLTIERINNDGNYEPDNCKWATMEEQLKNRTFRGMNK
ncbi:hypothetical protein [Bacillus toyonensis]|uniref:hypothetical protein n=1 Tax=Bacillus toyonensis TaxID=155322 RepID=UPI000BF76904|nr:hypothetical protein [Bacillus toyonensis]PGF00854.1 hypothetical protein COM61_22630 [Bacillus toyonensis]PHE47010.1 hypothetical protein COF71_13725 [Bacillus toyonensis]